MKKSIGRKTILCIHPVLIVGSYDEAGKPDIMAASWGGICCSEPPCVAVSLRKTRLSYDNIIFNKAFTINIPPVKYIEAADFSGTFSGRKVDKFKETGLTAIDTEIVKAPYVKEFPINIICKLVHTLEIGIHTQFIGEILDMLCDEDSLTANGLPGIEIINPFLYDSASRSYYSIGKKLSNAFSAKSRAG